MIINYNVSGSDRKQLVAAIAEHTGEKAKYLGAPGFAYQIGGFTVSVDGKVTIEDNSTAASLIRFLREKGFQAEDPLADCIADDADEDVETDEACGICISMPRGLFTDSSLENLKALIAAKGNLIKKALGVDDLPVEGASLILRNVDQLLVELAVHADAEVLVSLHIDTTFQGDGIGLCTHFALMRAH